MSFYKCCILIILSLSLTHLVQPEATLAAADGKEVLIIDADGVTRASTVVEDTAVVEFELVNEAGEPADGIEIYMTNTETGEVMSRTVIQGVSVFEDVSAGSWEITSSAEWAVFSNISISSSVVPVVAAGTSVLGISKPALFGIGGAAAAGGSVVAIHKMSAGNPGSGDGDPSPFPSQTPRPTLRPTPSPGYHPKPTPKPTNKPKPSPTQIEPSPFS